MPSSGLLDRNSPGRQVFSTVLDDTAQVGARNEPQVGRGRGCLHKDYTITALHGEAGCYQD
jgi:hypothetical protein